MNRLPEIDSAIFTFSLANIITFGCNSPALVKASRRRYILSEILEEFSSPLISLHATEKRSAKGGTRWDRSVGRGDLLPLPFPSTRTDQRLFGLLQFPTFYINSIFQQYPLPSGIEELCFPDADTWSDFPAGKP